MEELPNSLIFAVGLLRLMSSTDEEERREYVKRDPASGGSQNQPTVQSPAQSQPAESAPVERREFTEKRTSTNTTVIVAIAVGIVVLAGGIGLIAHEVPYIPWPYDVIVVVGLGFTLLAIGASFISSRTKSTHV
jgi:hypothetical protein